MCVTHKRHEAGHPEQHATAQVRVPLLDARPGFDFLDRGLFEDWQVRNETASSATDLEYAHSACRGILKSRCLRHLSLTMIAVHYATPILTVMRSTAKYLLVGLSWVCFLIAGLSFLGWWKGNQRIWKGGTNTR